METVLINDKLYEFQIGSGADPIFRNHFNILTRQTFGFDFETWYQGGYWKEQYLPYCLMQEDHIIANVSVNKMDLDVFGTKKHYIQLGTIMTDPSYRNQGLLRYLLEKVLAEWSAKVDFIYLFANDSVLDFYPKFGFTKMNQYQCKKEYQPLPCETMINTETNKNIESFKNLNTCPWKHLSMSILEDQILFQNYSLDYISYAALELCNNQELIMFYATSFLSETIFYLPDLDIIIMAEQADGILHLYGIFTKKQIPLETIISYLQSFTLETILLHFTPKDSASFTMIPLEGEDTLFALGKDSSLFENRSFLFPTLSHT